MEPASHHRTAELSPAGQGPAPDAGPGGRSIRAAALLGLALALAAGLAQLTASATASRIAHNRAVAADAALEAALPALRGRSWQARAVHHMLPGGVNMTAVEVPGVGSVRVLAPWPAPGGYAGPLELLVAVDGGGRVLHVEVLRHRETPGLGDRLERRYGTWLDAFNGRRAPAAGARRWAPDRDGGDFDTLTGATVTSRAAVSGVEAALRQLEALPGGGAGGRVP